jgi:hypothetical protein
MLCVLAAFDPYASIRPTVLVSMHFFHSVNAVCERVPISSNITPFVNKYVELLASGQREPCGQISNQRYKRASKLRL